MPHVVLEGHLNLQRFSAVYQPLVHQEADKIVKLQHAYVSTTSDEVLIEAVALQDGFAQRFLVQVLVRDTRATVKLYPGTDPEKTDAVKRTIALVARQLKDCSPDVRYGSTNIGVFLL